MIGFRPRLTVSIGILCVLLSAGDAAAQFQPSANRPLTPPKPSPTAPKTFTCPAKVSIGAQTFGPAELALKTAAVSAGKCDSSKDMSPQGDRGDQCMACQYDSGVVLVRSVPASHKCWVKTGTTNRFSCEYVAPLPPSQTCVFEVKPTRINMLPFDHVSGDKDLYTRTDDGADTIAAAVGGKKPSGAQMDLAMEVKREGDHLTLTVTGTLQETGNDKTKFAKTWKATVGDPDVPLVKGTKADIAACLAAYGTSRPFPPMKGTTGLKGADYNWLEVLRGQDKPLFAAHCKFDVRGDDVGQVGCDRVVYDQFSITIK